MRWLLRKFSMSPNAYYNYLKDRKKEYRKQASRIQKRIVAIYHQDIMGPLSRPLVKILSVPPDELS